MQAKPASKFILSLLTLIVASLFIIGSLAAQDVVETIAEATPVETSTPVPTEMPTLTPTSMPTDLPVVAASQPITVSGLSPLEFTEGTGGILIISGTNFTAATTVTLSNGASLPVTAQAADTLTVTVGTDVDTGVYSVQISDPTGGTQTTSSSITVFAPAVQLSVTSSEPVSITAGQARTLSILGTNFTSSSTVRLIGYGFLTTTYLSSTALTAALPASIPAGGYAIEVSDTTNGTAASPNILTVASVAVTSTPTPTPTTIPGQPELIISQFTASPSVINPSDSTQITLTITNIGSRTAEGVAVSLGNGSFTPANGQGSLILPDLGIYVAYTVTLTVTAADDATSGPQNIAVVMGSRDFSGQTYTDNGTVSVTIVEETKGESQIVLDSYQVTPRQAAPGTTVTVQALFKNTGTEDASQVLVSLSGSSVLLAGTKGSTYVLGDMAAGASVPVVMSFVVAESAAAGAQSQALMISSLQDGETKESTTSISLEIEEIVEDSPLLLLNSYRSGQDEALIPGQTFPFEMTLQNAGTVDVSNLLVTFGTVETSDSTASPDTSSTESSNSFVIYGSGDTRLLGTLAAGQTTTLTQDFIVNSDLASGIHNLSITLQYEDSDGTTAQKTLTASLMVVVPANIRITNTSELDDPLTVRQDATLTLKIANVGSDTAALSEMRVTGENVTISEGAQVMLDPLSGDDDTTESVTFVPQAEGTYTVTVEVDYVDDLNKTQTLTQAFTGSVNERTMPQNMPRPDLQTAASSTQDDDLLGRLLLGFLGIGG